MTNPLRIAMWSGPRNISTALMRAFENRPDCFVSDEPLYGAWLSITGEPHPLAGEIIAAMQCDWRRVVAALTGPIPGKRTIWYQKHMAHHLLPEMIERQWLEKLTHVFLIRDPAAVVASYLNKRGTVSVEEIGIPQQWRLHEFVRDELGQQPLVIDAGEFLRDPEAHLRVLCERLGIAFEASMLAWPPGPRDTDGVWATHWYANVWKSTGFDPPRETAVQLTGSAQEVAEACQPVYLRLRQVRLRP